MWCTRWFLPLLLLPLPTATPYFLILFLVSLTLHARPCFYCIILLTALFTSSCYWQPVPTEVIVGSIFPNASTDEALLYALNAATHINDSRELVTDLTVVPKLTLLNDRCWCDLSGTGLFEPFNTTKWQLNSFARTVGISDTPPKHSQDVHKINPTKTTFDFQGSESLRSNTKWITGIVSSSVRSLPSSEFLHKWFLYPFTAIRSNSVTPDASIPTGPNETSKESSGVDFEISAGDSELASAIPRIIRSTYDLRSYGIDLVVDFHWPRNSLNAVAPGPKL